MMFTSMPAEERLMTLIGGYDSCGLKMELLAFWGRHPRARFELSAISHALGYRKLEVDRALRGMIDSGIVDRTTVNSVILYGLTSDDEKRRTVLELASLGWDRCHLMMKKAAEKCGTGQPAYASATAAQLDSVAC